MHMHKNHSFLKGMGAGMAAGITVAAVGSAMVKNNKGLKKTASKALRAAGDVMENIQYMMK